MEFLEGGRSNDGVHKKYTQVITLTKFNTSAVTLQNMPHFLPSKSSVLPQTLPAHRYTDHPPSSCLSAGTQTLPTNQCCQEHKGVHAQLPLAIAKAGPGSTTQLSVQEQPYGISNTDCRINAEMWYDDTELVPNRSHNGAQSWTVPRWLFWS